MSLLTSTRCGVFFSLRQMLLAKPVGSGHIKKHGRNILPALPRCIMKTVLNVICFDFHLT